jgi:uncharacterized tellurite resistance protein B-like protein
MELSDLTPEEDVVLLGLLREVVTADGKYTNVEKRGVDRVRTRLGEARFDKAMQDAQSRFAQPGALKEAAKAVTRQPARAAIFAVLSDVAADDGMAQEEMKPLNWLASWWDLAR